MIHKYTDKEERLNVLTHAIGIPLSILALILMVSKADEPLEQICSIVFGVSLLLLYTASTSYHASRAHKLRRRLRVLDHVAIFILIAGTYTPLALIILAGDVGDIIFYVIWTIATLGTILKLFFTGKYNIVSTILYVLMGWVVIFAIRPLVQSMSVEGLFWVFTGGASYTLGAIIYSIDRIQFNHAIFHLFVLGGSFCHFMAMYFCVL